jgi:hypothetical protein
MGSELGLRLKMRTDQMQACAFIARQTTTFKAQVKLRKRLPELTQTFHILQETQAHRCELCLHGEQLIIDGIAHGPLVLTSSMGRTAHADGRLNLERIIVFLIIIDVKDLWNLHSACLLRGTPTTQC